MIFTDVCNIFWFWFNLGGFYDINIFLEVHMPWTSLVAQWLGIHLPTQGTRVQALGREDPTCHGATEPMCHNY